MSGQVVGKIEQLASIPGQPATFFGEPMVGITVKQFDEYRELRARAAEICKWKHCPEECDGYYETTCGEQSVWTTGDINSMKFCPDCGRKVEVKP
jgi:hypothetical protein